MQARPMRRFFAGLLHRLLVATGALSLTTGFFLVLPLMQAITKQPASDLIVTAVDSARLEPPPPVAEPEPEPEPEPEEPPPELAEETPLLALADLELALSAGFGDGLVSGDFAVKLDTVLPGADEVDELFSLADLDQKPLAVYQPSPVIDAKVRRVSPGRVYILFIVDQSGRVESPVVQTSSDPILERPALTAVKQWRFEPGKRNGQPVRFRMRVPITFPEGS